MTTLFTSLRVAAVLLTVACSTTPMLAQQAAHKAVPAKRTMATQPVRTVQRAKPAPASAVVSTPAQAPAAQTTAAPVQQQPTQAVVARHTTSRPAPATHHTRPAASGRHKYLNLGIGLATYYGGGLPVGASFEVDVKNNFSVGGSVDYFRYGYNNGYNWHYNFAYLGARGSYHLGEALGVTDKKFDPYIGATLGFRYAGYSDTYGYDNYSSPYNSGLYLGVHLGSRYMFSEKVGGFAEVGYGVSALRLGLTAKF